MPDMYIYFPDFDFNWHFQVKFHQRFNLHLNCFQVLKFIWLFSSFQHFDFNFTQVYFNVFQYFV